MCVYIIKGGSAEVELKKGETIKLTTNPAYQEKGNAAMIYVDYKNITGVVKPGNRIFIDDGLISIICESSTADTLVCTIENGGKYNLFTIFLPTL